MIERLIKYLLSFAIANGYEVHIPNIKGDKEIDQIIIDIKNKNIKIK